MELIDSDQQRELRDRMVREQLVARGITDERVLQRMRELPRHFFVPKELVARAYEDRPLPLGPHQTISQPYMVARMLEIAKLRGTERVLELGTGSGYQAALMAGLASEVVTIERVKERYEEARARFYACGIENCILIHGDGQFGAPSYAPFDRIFLTAAVDHIPPALVEQLAVGGMMLLPFESDEEQELVCIRKGENGLQTENFGAVRFVPMIPGKEIPVEESPAFKVEKKV